MEVFNIWESNIVLFVQENLRFGFLNPIMQFITSLGDEGIVPIALCIIFIIIKKTRKVGVTAGLSLALEAILINLTIKKIVGRTRPYVVNEAIEYITTRPSDNSFPSGHTGCMFAVASVLFYMMPKKVGIPAMIIASLVGISRLYVGVHYPTDIIAGFIIGMFTGFIAKLIVEKISKVLAKKKEEKLKTE